MSASSTEELQVMVVDDISSTRAIIKDMLVEIGFARIGEANGGQEALEKVKREGARLIVCDHSMKDMSGLELLKALRQDPQLGAIPFIVVSAVGDAPVIKSALAAGAADYIVKPINYQLLRRKVADVLRRAAAGE
jgi:two-component system chemotaxis response regulator CheY